MNSAVGESPKWKICARDENVLITHMRPAQTEWGVQMPARSTDLWQAKGVHYEFPRLALFTYVGTGSIHGKWHVQNSI